ncbi:MAG: xanthine dehydrogenase [Ponticaulis sp.]|nr:xanthine dehydrogenase [Ponticaulis sp.]|tara:strand:+ start:10950 stop:12515 length:1566 start_codon:yes stop_codon:yes gene_type:complete
MLASNTMSVYNGLMSDAQHTHETFPEDVLRRLIDWHADGHSVALAVIRDTQGGGVRAPGALMAIDASRKSSGYLSGGCIDSDIVLRAQEVIQTDKSQSLTYGTGSPFIDLPLPCGGSITVDIHPISDTDAIVQVVGDLKDRLETTIDWSIYARGQTTNGACCFTYEPRLRLRIAGRGADCLATAKLAMESGYDVQLQLPDTDDIDRAKALGITRIDHLTSVDQIPAQTDDRWTAFVLMFHDRHWEIPLLSQALKGNAFYIGAVGSQRTHAKRIEGLLQSGCSADQITSIHAPIGLIPACRDASSLAISVMSEIINLQSTRNQHRKPNISALVLAAGKSSRFEQGDKLLASLDGEAILSRTLASLSGFVFRSRLVVTGFNHDERARLAKAANWSVIENQAAELGQSTSLKLGISALNFENDVDAILVVLADMPFVPASHYQGLLNALTPETNAVMTESDGTLLPPAIFSKACFDHLMKLDGDRGAGQIFKSLPNTKTLELSPDFARDIDTLADLTPLEVTHG